MEYIYLLETRESVRLGDQIYKIGKSKQEAFKHKRINTTQNNTLIKTINELKVKTEISSLKIVKKNLIYKKISRARGYFLR